MTVLLKGIEESPNVINIYELSLYSKESTFDSLEPVLEITYETNAAPILNSATTALTNITEDDISNLGQDIASIVGSSISDSNIGAKEGIALTSMTSGNGKWQYSIDAGVNWIDVGTVDDVNALLLRDTDRIRFIPDGQNGSTASISYRAWDRTTGIRGNKADATINGGTLAFSSSTCTASILVTDVNDAPTLDTASPVFTGITEDDIFNSGSLFQI